MLENGMSLITWSFPPQLDLLKHEITVKTEAKMLPAHRLAYLDYEGEISDNRGTVRRIMQGCYLQIRDTDAFLFGEDGMLFMVQLYSDFLKFLPAVEVEHNAGK
jgi:hypothetical protein